MNYSPIEVKVREATNGDEPWGPHGSLMNEIASVRQAAGLRAASAPLQGPPIPTHPHPSPPIPTTSPQATFNYEDYPEAMGMLWRRILKDREGKHWRRIYKVGGVSGLRLSFVDCAPLWPSLHPSDTLHPPARLPLSRAGPLASGAPHPQRLGARR